MPFCVFYFAETFKIDIRFVIGLAFLGFVLDTVWVWLGILDYGAVRSRPRGSLFYGPPSGLRRATVLGSFAATNTGWPFAAVAAPISYFAGQRIGAAVLVETGGLVFVSVVWGVLFMGLFRLVEVVDGGSTH
ncbi:MAG: hypothetical protein Ct9H300mP8_07170 [Gammaproteobacteria bacterium]|nr:MAG: hypothetical protein Ct9H300mP8_07170 [Gammaproteobacteria bacterium]